MVSYFDLNLIRIKVYGGLKSEIKRLSSLTQFHPSGSETLERVTGSVCFLFFGPTEVLYKKTEDSVGDLTT